MWWSYEVDLRPAGRIVFAAIAALGLVVCVAVLSTASKQPPKPAAKAGASQVHSIVLPQYPPEIAAGPNVDTFRKNCLICHTARYVSMQPRFSKTVWQSEVKKMVDSLRRSDLRSRPDADCGVPGCGEGCGSAGHSECSSKMTGSCDRQYRPWLCRYWHRGGFIAKLTL